MASGWALAIDFGTSNTAAAQIAANSGAVTAVALSHTSNLMSSSVFVESPDSIVVGDVALNRAETNPAAYLAAPKRTISHGMTYVAGYDIPSSMPVAAVLQSVISRAVAQHDGQMPDWVVLTHPEAWSSREIQVLIDGAHRAGVSPGRIMTVSEPRAAAAWYARSASIPTGARIAVFDFGGGTLDVAVLTASADGTFSVLAARGDNGLGGKNLDAFIRRWIDEQLEDRNPDMLAALRTSATPESIRALDESIRRAKELLSEAPSASITVTAPGGLREVFQLTRDELDDIIGPEIDKGVALTLEALQQAGVPAGGLQALYLTGGSSRIPLVHQRLAALGKIATLDDPKTVVARGALVALQAGACTPAAVPGTPAAQSQSQVQAQAQVQAQTQTQPQAQSQPTRHQQQPIPQSAPQQIAPQPVARHQVTPQPTTAGPSWQPSEPAASTATATATAATKAAGGGRKRLMIGGGVVLALVVALVVVLVATNSGGSDSAAPGTAATSTQQSAASEEQAVRDLASAYIDAVSAGDKATLTSLRCSSFVTAAPTTTSMYATGQPEAKQTYALKSLDSLTILGDSGSARATVAVTGSDGSAPTTASILFTFGKENGQWKVCESSVQ
ncbi:Hsp70 family protein [Speluncibacter jeojiensis]|uniref:Hsp70 family protein n=1 Tax=Speluncibacter jeojiensis TaxID=2710754 RepID=A0A9X4M4W4_9ACTN|nr:Hsp70 family protein [Corynebacteriales bacterium D3-21]